MQLKTYASTQDLYSLEIQRLLQLVPPTLPLQVMIEALKHTESKPAVTRLINSQSLLVQINFSSWQLFSTEQRNLLFWREIAQVQRSLLLRSSRNTVLKIAVISLWVELISQNLAGVLVALSIMSLGIFELYQEHWGERFFKRITTVDQGAVVLAREFGYSLYQAQDSLYGAIKILLKHKLSQTSYKENQTRLRVLEIMKSESSRPSDQSIFASRNEQILAAISA